MSIIKYTFKKAVNKYKFLYFITQKIKRIGKNFKSPISGINNIINNKGVLINVKYNIRGNNNSVTIMHGALISDTTIYMRGNNHSLKIGENVAYRGGCIWFEDENCSITIGKNTVIESAHLAVTEPNKSIIIGTDCLFSSNIEFRTGDSHSIIDIETKKRINMAQNIEVGNHVWIGAQAVILKGVHIGNNSIVGIRSIVTKNIPNNVVMAGAPAKVIKNDVDWLVERI